jgi:pimeloyl-ACP methyl ester carboxylesterase
MGEYRFDIARLTARVRAICERVSTLPETSTLPLALFGASTGAAAALCTAAQRPDLVRAVVSRGGRPDLAGPMLSQVRAPTLLIVGGLDTQVAELNRAAQRQLGGPNSLWIVPGATHLFPEPGALEQVAGAAGEWFDRHLGGGDIALDGYP